MKKVNCIFILFIIFITACSPLSGNFEINIYLDNTTNSGTYLSITSLTFKEKELISGNSIFDSTDINSVRRRVECNLDTNTKTWHDKETKEQCTGLENIPLSLELLKEKINSGEYKKGRDQCGPSKGYCYELMILN